MVPSEYGTARSSSTLKRLYPLQKGLYRLRMPTCSLPGCRDQAVVEHVCELVNAGGVINRVLQRPLKISPRERIFLVS